VNGSDLAYSSPAQRYLGRMERAQSSRKKRELTPEAFTKLLAILDPDPETAGGKYEQLRRKLIKFFEWRGSFISDELADETLNRLARKIDEGEEIEKNVFALSLGIARFVLLETLKRPDNNRVEMKELATVAINDLGQIVGHVGLLADDTLRGFLYDNGAIIQIDYPNALNTNAIGINNLGQITGYFIEAGEAGNRIIRGFPLTNGVYKPIDFPEAPNTQAYGINNRGEIVGVFGVDFDTARGFLLSNGVYTPIDFPEATATLPYGINDLGQIVGEFTDNTGTHGFLATREQ
jgi:hypothetical protein